MRLVSLLSAAGLLAGLASASPLLSPEVQRLGDVKVIRQADSPTPRLAMYVQTFHDEDGNPLSLLPLQGTGITHVILASLHLNGSPGDIHLNDDPPNSTVFDQAWSDCATLQANGIKVMAMMGGAGDGSYNDLADDFDAYYEPLLTTVIQQYNLDGFDLDIEVSVDISVPVQLLTQLYTDMGSEFLLTMAPVASALQSPDGGDLSGFSYFDLDTEAVIPGTTTPLVTWYNAQFYSGFGDPSSTGTYQSIIEAGWDPARVVMGVLDSSNDGSGWVDIGTLQSTIESLRALYPTFGGVDGWEYFDAGSSDGDSEPYEWVESISSALTATVSKRDVTPINTRDMPYPRHPFSDEAVAALADAGHYKAVRALNMTQGNVEAARVLLK